MYTMRERILFKRAAEDAAHDATIIRQLDETSRLAATLAKLEATEDQLRQAQATLIAERVARTHLEGEWAQRDEDVRDTRDELTRAVRALQRARDEGRRTDEERRRINRCFEETKTQ